MPVFRLHTFIRKIGQRLFETRDLRLRIEGIDNL
jgi:hypothetical protein